MLRTNATTLQKANQISRSICYGLPDTGYLLAPYSGRSVASLSLWGRCYDTVKDPYVTSCGLAPKDSGIGRLCARGHRVINRHVMMGKVTSSGIAACVHWLTPISLHRHRIREAHGQQAIVPRGLRRRECWLLTPRKGVGVTAREIPKRGGWGENRDHFIFVRSPYFFAPPSTEFFPVRCSCPALPDNQIKNLRDCEKSPCATD